MISKKIPYPNRKRTLDFSERRNDMRGAAKTIEQIEKLFRSQG
jgi:hypothetical protein